MRSISHALVFSLVLGWIAACRAPEAGPASDLTGDQYAIYKLAIEEVAQPLESLPVLGRTVPNHQREFDSRELYLSLKTSLPGLNAETLDDFWARNQDRSELEYRLDLTHGSVFIRDEDAAKVPGYPGYVEISNVGFDKSAMQALVYIGHCWELSGMQGRGYFLMCERGDGGWRIVRKQIARMR